MNWISQNLGMILSVIAGGGGITAVVKSFHWVRPYERLVVTSPRGLIMNKQTGEVREYTGFVFRILGFYRTAVVNIRDRLDNILLEVMRPAVAFDHPDHRDHREKWVVAATVEWHVVEGLVYRGCEWQINDLGEFVRGEIQHAILTFLEAKEVTMDLDTEGIFAACEPLAKERLLDHGVQWTKLMVNKNTLADAEIQGQAIRRIAKAIEHWVASLIVRRSDSS